jgi:hypothetical protein
MPLKLRPMHRLCIFSFVCLLPLLGQDTVESAAPPEIAPMESVPLADIYQSATVATAKTSIYIGAVTLTTQPFVRDGTTYRSTYSAKVFPFFFYNESGRLSINLSDDDLRELATGKRVYFKGEAFSSKDEPRRVEGHADPSDAFSGRIKVRVWVSKNIELIFNTTYQFDGKSD